MIAWRFSTKAAGLLIICAWMTACGPSQPAASLQEHLGADYAIEHTSGTDFVTITHTMTGIWNAQTPFRQIARDIERTANWMQQTGKWEANRLEWRLVVPLTDHYGNETPGVVLVVSAYSAELKKINYANLYGEQFLRFAELRLLARPAFQGAIEFCRDNAIEAASFCRQILRRIRL